MAIRPKVLVEEVLLTASNDILYTVGDNILTKVFEVVLCNNSPTLTIGVNVHFVKSGSVAAAKNKIYAAGVGGLNLAPLETKTIGMEQRMETGASIVAGATVTDLVSIRASGDEVS